MAKANFYKTAFEKIVDYLAIRDHSEKELRTKLSRKDYSEVEINDGIEFASEHGLLLEPKILAQKVSDSLHRKNKGILYINQYLKSKDLPAVHPDWEVESKKAQALVLKKIKSPPPYSYEEKQEIYRYLANRGFTDLTINKTIHGK